MLWMFLGRMKLMIEVKYVPGKKVAFEFIPAQVLPLILSLPLHPRRWYVHPSPSSSPGPLSHLSRGPLSCKTTSNTSFVSKTPTLKANVRSCTPLLPSRVAGAGSPTLSARRQTLISTKGIHLIYHTLPFTQISIIYISSSCIGVDTHECSIISSYTIYTS